MNSSTHNLLFLLAAAPMGLGACATSSDESSGEETVGDGDDDGDTNPVCQAYADHYDACFQDPRLTEAAAYYCSYSLSYYESYGPDCTGAIEAYFGCLSTVPCEDLLGENEACIEQSNAFEQLCQ